MVLGNATQKIQKIIELAEVSYERVNEVREELLETQETVGEIKQSVGSLEAEIEDHRVLLEALAHEHDIDVERLFTEEDEVAGDDP